MMLSEQKENESRCTIEELC
ncbi:hypothetical protein R3I94_020921 [Phoxinus phoxinus]